MIRTPTGKLVKTADGTDLVLTRTFRAPIDDVWASVTESERTARWYGPWKGDAGQGKTIQVQMVYEDSPEWMDLTIDACEPPSRLAVSTVDDMGTWRMELILAENGGTTELKLVQHLDKAEIVGDVGPGWEYYLDMLVAARNDEKLPSFDEYYPAQKEYFLGQLDG
ncbi:uncharacterized protein YndB with AHSA1/START domain [Herbihabitans rhizosphaerae]|uniref:Uncharacterized protein YndB with AHSA1/START domain n=1 Tax=Herbihabitans rhizosphaerae TaxID=1872711 RepID=A0A4Q7KHG4_9PSEU|nr:SRPBCC family protein [Herbihabitans rhizosphaerae]RZS34350.1 uncharacterized protein YndB with AHSA1/START domain [Herbihabitans rhizosphaerae]